MNAVRSALLGTLILGACAPSDEAESASAVRDAVTAADSAHAGHTVAAQVPGDSTPAHAGHAAAPVAAAGHAGHAGHTETTAGPAGRAMAAAGAHAGHVAPTTARAASHATGVHTAPARAAGVPDLESAPIAAGHHVEESAAAVRAPEADPGADRLLQLGRGLARDSAVRAAIEADPALRERWNDPAVRGQIEPRR